MTLKETVDTPRDLERLTETLESDRLRVTVTDRDFERHCEIQGDCETERD